MIEIKTLIKKYPKQRPPLSKEMQRIYASHYKKNRDGSTRATSISSKMEEWLHKKVAKDTYSLSRPFDTLEIGAGTLNQLQYEKPSRIYDIIEPFRSLFENNPLKSKLRNVFEDINEITIQPTYDRVTAIATFEHVLNLPDVIARGALLMKPGGTMRVSIPNEGTVMWKLGTQITGFEFRRMYGMDYQELMRHEHVNTEAEIRQLLNHFFNDVKCTYFGLNRHLAFYAYIQCSNPDIQKCKDFLSENN